MSKRTVIVISVFITALFAATLLAACGSKASPSPSATSAPSSGGSLDGQALMQQRCTVCHSTDRITSAHKTADQWKMTVDRMIGHGAQLSPQEEQTLINYLAQNYK